MTTWILLRSFLPWFPADAGCFALPAWLPIFSTILVFSPLIEGGTTHVAAMVIRLLVLLLLCVYAWNVVRQRRLFVPSFAIGPPVVVFLMLAAISVVWSPYRNQSIQWLIVLVSDAGLLFVLTGLITTWGHVVWAVVLLVGMGVFEAGWALHQGGFHDVARPVGTFANPNFLAGYLAATWCVLLGSLLYWKIRRGEGRSWLWRIGIVLSLCVGMVLLGVIIWTRSRGGLLALAAGAAGTMFLRFGWRGFIGVVLLVAVVVTTPNPLSTRIRMEHTVNPVGYARWQMWRGAADQMLDYPFGAGLGLYQYLYPRYAFPIEGQVARYGKVAQTPHSEYAQIGVELGVVALAVFCWGIGLVVREVRVLSACRLRRWQRGIVAGAGGAAASILVHAAVDSNLHEPAVVISLILCVAVLFSVKRLSQSAPQDRTVLIQRPIFWGGVFVLTVILSTILVVRLGVAWMAFEAGSRALEHNNPERALEYLGQAVELDPGKALYHSSVATAHFQIFQRTREQAHLAVVVEELKNATVLNPLSAKPLKLLGDAYAVTAAGSGQPDRQRPWVQLARAAYEQAVEREPFNPWHRLELGRLYLALGAGEQAERSVRSAVDIEPNYLPGRLWLAMRYLRTDRIELAKQEYEEILQRQRYYAMRALDSYEKSFLDVDSRELAASLERARGGKRRPGRHIS